MSLDRGKIIEAALREIGEVSTYNDNRSDTYQFASTILEDILGSLAVRTDLRFNATTVKLNKDGVNELGQNRFNIPVDYLNKLRFVNSTGEFEGNYIYSYDDEVYLKYCRTIALSEYPEYMYNLLVLMTALKVSESMNAFSSRVELLNTRTEQELQRLYNNQFVPYVRDVV